MDEDFSNTLPGLIGHFPALILIIKWIKTKASENYPPPEAVGRVRLCRY
jgi:hypothetical protein